MDFDLLQTIRNRDNYNRFKPYIKEHTLGKEAAKIVNSLGTYLKDYPSITNVDWEAFSTWFCLYEERTLSKESLPTYRTIFHKLSTTPPSPSADGVLGYYITADYATRIANEALKGGNCNLDQIDELIKNSNLERSRALKLSDMFEMGGVSEALKSASEPGLSWRLNELNISVGPLRTGDFLIVTARPEVGKTTFIASEVSYMATQMGTHKRPIIWINNEERSSKVMLRIQQAALGWSLPDILANETKANEEYNKLVGEGRIMVLKNDARATVEQLSTMFHEHNPALIVFDQLDKVAGFHKEEQEHARLGKLYLWARELSHLYGPVIAASQASEQAENLRYLSQNHLRGSKTDKPGEADAIIGIGKTDEVVDVNARFIHVMKNKLFGGGPLFDEAQRHGKWEVVIKPEFARYEGTK